MQWWWFSLVASVVLTVVLNLAIRRWPGGAGRNVARLDDWARRQVRHPDGAHGPDGSDGRRVRVIVPWKAMLIVSVVATVLLNVLLRLG